MTASADPVSERTVHKTCNICEAMCGLLIDVADNRVVRIRADRDDPFSRGHICPKAMALEQVQEDPDRLRFPVRRTDSGWQRIGWDEAFSRVAARLAELQARHGDDSVATYMGNPAAHNFGTLMYLTALNTAVSTRSKYSASSLDQNPKHAACYFLYGNTLSIPIPDLDRTQFLLLLGANPVVSNGGLFTAPGFAKRIGELKSRGGKFVVVDPRRTETAEIADEHIFIAPGDDALLLAALIYTVFDEELLRENAATSRLAGLPALRDAIRLFAPERVATRLGMPAPRLRALAREFAAADSAVCYGRFGTCANPYGTLNSWLIEVLNLLTGNLDSVGGAMFATPAADLPGVLRWRGATGNHDSWRTRVRGAPAFNDEQPSACLAEEILTPGQGQVRGLITIAGNPARSAPNSRALEGALAQLDFYVAIDFYINESTRYADVILPPTWSLEHDNYEVIFHLMSVRNTSKYSARVLEPEPGTRHDWQILSELALRILEHKAQRPARALYRCVRALGLVPSPRRVLDWMLRIGSYGDAFRPWRRGLRLRDLEAAPQGVDLGPLRPALDDVLDSGSRTIALDTPVVLAELGRLDAELRDAASANGLRLIGRRQVRRCNSWLGNVQLAAKGGERCDLRMHPEDARARGLEDGARVAVRSASGHVDARLRVSDEMMPGVVSLPHGWGHDVEGVELRVARETPGINCNELTDDSVLEPVVGNAVLNGVPVEVSAIASP